jgi:hypothetical protein
MKKLTLVLIALIATVAGSVHAQPGRMSGPSFSGAMAKLFGGNTTFTADIEIQMHLSAQQTRTMPGKISFDSGKSRVEMDMSSAAGGQPGIAEHMKAMGMDKTVIISRPDTKLVYTVFPGLTAYIENPIQDPDASKPDSAFKMESTELGRETVDGHVCVKNKVVVTDDQGKTHESTVWNAIDLKKFPVKMEITQQERTTTIFYKNVKTAKPDAALFDAPADYKKYDNQQSLMQEVMQRMGRGMQMPPGHP